MIPEEGIAPPKEGMDDKLDPHIIESNSQTSPKEELKNFLIDHQDLSKMLQVGKSLASEVKKKLKNFLRINLNVFT